MEFTIKFPVNASPKIPLFCSAHAQTHARTETQTHACTYRCTHNYKGRKETREVTEPWDGHERSTVHKANATLHSGTSKPSVWLHKSPRTASSSSRSFSVPLGTGTRLSFPVLLGTGTRLSFPVPLGTRTRLRQWRHSQRWRLAVYAIHWYTIHNSSTDDRGLGRPKTYNLP